jgi:hypothetical protein
LEGKRIKIFNAHGFYEITGDEDSLTGTFNQLECAYKDIDISKCQDNVKVKILDQFTISNQVAVKVDVGELKFGLNSVSLYPVKGEKVKLCDNGHVIYSLLKLVKLQEIILRIKQLKSLLGKQIVC